MKRLQLTLLVAGLFLFALAALADWKPAQRITWASGDSFNPAIAVDPSGNLHVVWYGGTIANYEVYYGKSTDGGATWTSGKRLTWNSGWSKEPVIAADSSGHLHVVWRDETPGNSEIFYRMSTDGGTTWASTKRLTRTPGYSEYASLAVDPSGHPHVVWDDDTPGNTEIYYMKSTDGGGTWTSIKRLTSTSGWPGDPEIAADSFGRLHVVFHYDKPGNDEIYYKKSADGGGTWSPNRRLTWTSGTSWAPVVIVDSSDFLHVIYYDDTPENDEIYYLTSGDGGATWTSGWSRQPAIAASSSGDLHVVWYGKTTGNCEIFYKKGN